MPVARDGRLVAAGLELLHAPDEDQGTRLDPRDPEKTCWTRMFLQYGGFHKWWYPNSWMVYNGTSH